MSTGEYSDLGSATTRPDAAHSVSWSDPTMISPTEVSISGSTPASPENWREFPQPNGQVRQPHRRGRHHRRLEYRADFFQDQAVAEISVYPLVRANRAASTRTI